MASSIQIQSQEQNLDQSTAFDSEIMGSFKVLRAKETFRIFSYLEPKDLVSAACLNSQFHTIAFDDELWQTICREWGVVNIYPTIKQWKDKLRDAMKEQLTVHAVEKEVQQQRIEEYQRNSFGNCSKGTVAILEGVPCRLTSFRVSKPGVSELTRYHVKGIELFNGRERHQEFGADDDDDDEEPTQISIDTFEEYVLLHFESRPSQDSALAYLVNRRSSRRILPIPQGEARRIMAEYYNHHNTHTCVIVVTVGSVVWAQGTKKAEGVFSIHLSVDKQNLMMLKSAYDEFMSGHIIDTNTKPLGGLQGLPNELVFCILSFLSPKDLATIARLNHWYYSISQDDSLWKPIAIQSGHVNKVYVEDSYYYYNLKTEIAAQPAKQKAAEREEKKKGRKSRFIRSDVWDTVYSADIVMLASRPCIITKVRFCVSYGSSIACVAGLDFITSQPRSQDFHSKRGPSDHPRCPVVPRMEQQEYRILHIREILFEGLELVLLPVDDTSSYERRFFLYSDDTLKPHDQKFIEQIRPFWVRSKRCCHVIIQRVSWECSSMTSAGSVERVVAVRFPEKERP